MCSFLNKIKHIFLLFSAKQATVLLLQMDTPMHTCSVIDIDGIPKPDINALAPIRKSPYRSLLWQEVRAKHLDFLIIQMNAKGF